MSSEVYRREIKTLINPADVITLRNRLSKILRPDVHNGGDYLVTSLYFDNYNDRAVFEKLAGMPQREKWRIRYYNQDVNFLRLEHKIKIGVVSRKSQYVITSKMVDLLVKTNSLTQSQSGTDEYRSQKLKVKDTDLGNARAAAGTASWGWPTEFYAKSQFQNLRPKEIVRYRRRAWQFEPGNVRVTLDTDIRASAVVDKFLEPDRMLTMPVSKHCILEVKFDHFLPELVQRAIVLPARNQAEFSKYAVSRIAI
jgi:SPX domain protein involved in polyphosphate accumulation